MDPNATLNRLREWVKSMPEGDQEAIAMEYFQSLDRWMSKGGFIPDDWARE